MTFLQPILMCSWSFGGILICCEFGEMVTNRFKAISDIIYDSDWYSFPMGIQRVLPTIMVAAQRPVVLMGFGNVPLTRENFKKVKHLIHSFRNDIINHLKLCI